MAQFPIFLIVIFLMAILLPLIIKNRRLRKYSWFWGLGIAVTLLMFFFIMSFFFTSNPLVTTVRDPYQQTITENSSYHMQTQKKPSYSSVEPFWQVTVENEFEADLYPSLEQTAKALGQKMAPKVASIATKQNSTLDAYITRTNWGSSETATMERKCQDSIRNEILNILQLPSLQLNVDKGTEGKRSAFPTGSMVLQVKMLNWTRGPAPWARWSGQQTNGQLEVSLRYGREEIKESIAFVEKPWVTNFSLFLSLEPGDHYVIAQSKQPCTSSSEARRQALDDAAEQLAYRIMKNADRYRELFNLGERSRWKLEDIQSLVRTELDSSQSDRSQATAGSHAVDSEVSYVKVNNRRGKYISDRFVQGFQRPYGAKIWREALLVNMSKENIDELAGKYADTIREKRESWLRIVLSALGMLALVCVVYVFLNSATKGYYRAALRVAAVLLAIVILGIAMVLA